ncbi:MAG TPA: DoxX family protein [Solirubrobacteraceae bacterium]
MKLGRLLLRFVVGGFFIGHGTQKLFGWFGGNGLKATAEGFDQLGLKPAQAHATAAGVAEAGGGALLVAGLETPLAAAAITATMITAVRTVHLKNGPWASNGGYEYNVVLIAAALALAELGPGPLSLDAARGHERSGAGWALAAAGAGAVGALGAHLTTKLQPAAEAFKNAGAASTPVAPPEPAGQSQQPGATSAEAA